MRKSIKAWWFKIGGKIRRKPADAHSHQTTPTPSVVPKTPSRDNLPPPIPPPDPNAEPEPHELAAQPSSMQTTPDAANIRIAVRLWTDAYDRIDQEDPKLVEAYKQILYSKLRNESSAANIPKGKDGETDPEPTSTQMLQFVDDTLENTERKAAMKDKWQDWIGVVFSVKEVVSTALQSAPEAATVWGGVCLLLQVSYSLEI